MTEVTLTEAQMPNHNHTMFASGRPANNDDPAGDRYLGTAGSNNAAYASPNNLVTMASASLPSAGGSQAHNNLQPLLAMNFIIALVGLYPSRS